MPKINGVDVAEGLPTVSIKNRVLTLTDFNGDKSIYDSYLMMMEVAKKMDKTKVQTPIVEKK